MLQRLTLTACLLAGCAWCVALVARANNDPPTRSHRVSFAPSVPVKHLMYGQGVVFRQIKNAVSEPGTPQREKTILAFSSVLAELSNVNTLHAEKSDYMQWAVSVRDTALELASEAAKAAEADNHKMNGLLEKLGQTCGACHEVYQ